MRFPSIATIRSELANKQRWLRRSFARSDLPEGTEVRLQVLGDGRWAVYTGDASYDQDHRGYWGAATLPLERCNLTDLARDLLEQAREVRSWDRDCLAGDA